MKAFVKKMGQLITLTKAFEKNRSANKSGRGGEGWGGGNRSQTPHLQMSDEDSHILFEFLFLRFGGYSDNVGMQSGKRCSHFSMRQGTLDSEQLSTPTPSPA